MTRRGCDVLPDLERKPDRFIALVDCHTDLLTHDEQILWKLIQEESDLWASDPNREPALKLTSGGRWILVGELRRKWEKLKEKSHGG